MGMQHTIQSSYEALRSAIVTSADATLTSYKSTDRPSDIWSGGPEVGGVGIIFIGTGADDATFSWSLHAYRTVGESNVGPAEFIANGTGILGAAVSEVGDRYADTISITEAGSWYDVPVAVDSGNNRICKVCFDLCGFKYILVQFTDIGGVGEATGMNAYISYF